MQFEDTVQPNLRVSPEVVGMALDKVEASLHDVGTHAVAVLVARGVLTSYNVPLVLRGRAESILRSVQG